MQLLWGPSSKKKKLASFDQWNLTPWLTYIWTNCLQGCLLDQVNQCLLLSGYFFFNSWQSRTIARSTTEKTTLAWVDCSCGRGHFSSLWLKEFVKYYEREFLMNCSGFLHLFWIAQAFCTILCFFFFSQVGNMLSKISSEVSCYWFFENTDRSIHQIRHYGGEV